MTDPKVQEQDWVLVPREPTEAMTDAAIHTFGTWADCYRAMLAAAPAPASHGEPSRVRAGFTANPGEPVPCALCTGVVAVHENDWCTPPEYVLMCLHGDDPSDPPTIAQSGTDRAQVIANWNKFHDGIRDLAAGALALQSRATPPGTQDARAAADEIFEALRPGTFPRAYWCTRIAAIITKHHTPEGSAAKEKTE